MLLDDRGVELARHPQERGFSQQAASDIRIEVNERAEAGRQAMFVAERGSLAGRAVAVPVPLGRQRPAWALARRSPAAAARSATSSACSPARRRWWSPSR